MAYQKLIIVGNLGRDPEMRYTPDGTPVTTLSVATNRKWNNPDGTKGEETTWFRVTVWRKQAEVAAQYLSKGQQVMIEGRLAPDRNTGGPRIWTRQDGTAGASYEVTADRIVLLGSRGGEVGGAAAVAETPEDYTGEEEIPF
ncbi:MAG TPA: single-stranded DNA-binding protein [Anaerolineae bacterium]|nr:single-stranded DNA-binding protein [Anaerolineae bacterium]HQK12364.1 single-stranded DNA-binding protein [Anaerolineae bacterium]